MMLRLLIWALVQLAFVGAAVALVLHGQVLLAAVLVFICAMRKAPQW